MKIFAIIAAALGLAGLLAAVTAGVASAYEVDDIEGAEGLYGPPYIVEEVPESGDDSTDDETALARMLASEDRRSYGARVVIGWMAAQRGKKYGLYAMLTKGHGYGPQLRGDEAYYASTAQLPRQEDRDLAVAILDKRVQPSQQIRSHGPGGWIERHILGKQTGQPLTPAEEDARLMEMQGRWKQGIYGRVGSWYLFSSKAPILLPDQVEAVMVARANKDTAAQAEARATLAALAPSVLDQVPSVPALDA